MAKYSITIDLETDNGNPAKWNWSDLLDESNILNVQVKGSE